MCTTGAQSRGVGGVYKNTQAGGGGRHKLPAAKWLRRHNECMSVSTWQDHDDQQRVTRDTLAKRVTWVTRAPIATAAAATTTTTLSTASHKVHKMQDKLQGHQPHLNML